jgi:hypothetical protein
LMFSVAHNNLHSLKTAVKSGSEFCACFQVRLNWSVSCIYPASPVLRWQLGLVLILFGLND